MRESEFEALVREGFERLPKGVREKIRNVALLVEDEPSAEVRKREGLRKYETLLGYYQGIPLSYRGDNYGVGPTLPDTITLYKLPIEDEAHELLRASESHDFKEAVTKVVRDTIWHEFAHHFGMNEGEVSEREEKRL
ncbi:MAG: metallopeptidase family protein [bacterium]|nr:metallopeptidase family protein [bacterium]